MINMQKFVYDKETKFIQKVVDVYAKLKSNIKEDIDAIQKIIKTVNRESEHVNAYSHADAQYSKVLGNDALAVKLYRTVIAIMQQLQKRDPNAFPTQTFTTQPMDFDDFEFVKCITAQFSFAEQQDSNGKKFMLWLIPNARILGPEFAQWPPTLK